MMSCSDEAKIKIWNYQKDFSLVATLDEHKHFVMAMAFNPRDLTKFASGSMDKTIKLWNITSEGKANMTLSGHKAGVNCLDFYRGDRPHIVSGSDDRTIKIWDYQTKQCLNTITTHTLAVSAVTFHPDLPILISTG
jgi:coatomer subunit beta'